ncbi:MAG: hypothetical protein U0807_14155 [Candidatus Binatia bacterium]
MIQHFFDPQRGAGLTTCPLPPCHPSPDWALEDRGMVRLEDDRLCLGPAESPDCRQTFSYGDARRAMLAGLQGETEQDRKVQFGRMFEALGHVVHHLQDMAQPQHARDDVHLAERRYEDNAEETYGAGAELYSAAGAPGAGLPRELWATPSHGGIAYYSNENFVTTDTDFRAPYTLYDGPLGLQMDATADPAYPLPSPIGATVTAATYQEILNQEPPVPEIPLAEPPLDGRIYFIGTAVHDPELGDEFNAAATTLSIYDHDLRFAGIDPCPFVDNFEACREAHFTQNWLNFYAARRLLLPKAIAYSASLLDYFFRGEMGVCWGGETVPSVLKNLGAETMRGTIGVFATNPNGTRFRIGEWTTDERLPPDVFGNWYPNTLLTLPPFPQPQGPGGEPLPVLVVFHGAMGGEGPSSTFSEAIVSQPLDTSHLCTRRLWQVDAASSGLRAYALGPDGLPAGSAAVVIPDNPALAVGSGVAYDPTDTNLWVTSAAQDGSLWKLTQTGQVVKALFVTGTLVHQDGPLQGQAQIDFSALAMDPDDPHFLWVSGASAYRLDQVPVYKVRLDAAAAPVVQTCIVRRSDAPVASSGGNSLLAAGPAQIYRALFLTAPNQAWQGNRLFGTTTSCAPVGHWDIFPPPPGVLFTYPTGIELNGRGELLAAVVEPSAARTFYNLGRLPAAPLPLDAPVASAPAEGDGDIAIGSDF